MTVNNKKGEKEDKIKVTLPVSDTVPGPGNYLVEILNMNGSAMPVVDGTDLIDSLGAGTAQDISSTEQAPTSKTAYAYGVQRDQDETT